ncbi:hypothetical protein F5050DRAFT_1813069 [Lentinula boryana]|uniref:Uncharacterized protein n=1 Tax=Lentinula boryana TaxID=40481 RepID=A0ABQ8PY58_9AGAR|nr:hypothetical protein F5050DRAFT_1813069 [Lentinula boryana]
MLPIHDFSVQFIAAMQISYLIFLFFLFPAFFHATVDASPLALRAANDHHVVEIELLRTTEDNIPISEESLQTIMSHGVDANEDWRLCVDAACLMSVFDPQQQMKVYRRDWEGSLERRGCYTAIGVVTFDTQSHMDASVKYLMEELPEVAKPTDNLQYLNAMVKYLQSQHNMKMKQKARLNQDIWDIYYGAMAKALQNEKAKKEGQDISTNTPTGSFVKPPIPVHKG